MGYSKYYHLVMYHFIKVIQNAPCYFLIITKIINNIVIKHLLLTVIALCMDTFALATPPVLQSVHT